MCSRGQGKESVARRDGVLQAQNVTLLVGEDELLLLAEVRVVVQHREDRAPVGVKAIGLVVADRDYAAAERVVVVHADGKRDRVVCAQGYH